MPVAEINLDLEPCVLTDKEDSKTLPCRNCGRPCVVTRFASPQKTECTFCRKGLPAPEAGVPVDEEPGAPAPAQTLVEPEFDESLEPEILTDTEKTKTVPCRKCKRACVVTLFATASKVECLTCRGKSKEKQHEATQIKQAHTVNPATLDNLKDGLVNPIFKQEPYCPFDQEHTMLLVSICHSPNYGPRRLRGYSGKGMPVYDQTTGESVVYQCQECQTVVSFSTMHPLRLHPQNHAQVTGKTGPGILEQNLGVVPDPLYTAAETEE